MNKLKSVISQKSNEVIAFNQQLKENAIQETQQSINELINTTYAIQNKIENILHQKTVSDKRIEEMKEQLEQYQEDIEETRSTLLEFVGGS